MTMKDEKRDDLVAKARALSALIEAQAPLIEESKTRTPGMIGAFKSSELFWLLVPKELGGADVDLVTDMEAIEEVTSADGSTGWTLMANSLALQVMSVYAPDAGVEKM